MLRAVLACVVLALPVAPLAGGAQVRPLQADGVVRLLVDLETALQSGREESFQALAGAALPPADAQLFTQAVAGGTITDATVRERARRPVGEGYEVLTEVLLSYGRAGRIATWQLRTGPQSGTADRVELLGLTEIGAIDGLLRLALDPTRQFAIHDFTFHAPDLTLEMRSGSAFVAESGGGITALVMRGRGEVRFAPPDPAEQGQLRIFAGKDDFTTSVTDVFIRLNPAEIDLRVFDRALTPVRVSPSDLERAEALFDEMAPRTFNVDLRDLAQDRWSLEPSFGSIVVEFRAGRRGWLTYARSPSEDEDVSFFDRARNKNISIYASAASRAIRLRPGNADASYVTERSVLDLAFDPTRSWISGRGSLHVRVQAVAISSLTIRLAQSLAISSVSSPTFGRLLALRVVGQHSLLVSLPRAVPRGTALVIDVAYSGRLEPQVLDREAITLGGDPAQQDPGRADQVTIMPEPRFMYSNRVPWYPQSPEGDYATGRARLTVPSEYQVVASGTLVGSTVRQVEATAGQRGDLKSVRTVEFVADRPARYLSCVISRFVPLGRVRVDVPSVAPATRVPGHDPAAGESPGVNIEIVSTPRMTSRNRQLAPKLADIVRFYATLVGEAPYPDFTVAAIDDNLPGGHSPAYFAILHQPLPTTPFSWRDDPVAFDHVPYFFLAHEVAHQWWGQAVGWKNYHEQWLSEGLAQYFALLYTAADRGPDVERSLLGQMRSSVMPLTNQGPILLGYRLGHIQGEGRIFRGIVYNKSALVLHMLRALVGDDAFFGALRRFYGDWRFRKADTEAFRVALEAASSMPLERFFDRWVRGSALPRLRVTSAVADQGSAASIRVDQIGDVFDVPVVLSVQYADGSSEDVTVAVTDATVETQLTRARPIRRVTPRDELMLAAFVR